MEGTSAGVASSRAEGRRSDTGEARKKGKSAAKRGTGEDNAEEVMMPGRPPRARFMMYFGFFIEYAVAVIGARRHHLLLDEHDGDEGQAKKQKKDEWGTAEEAGEEMFWCGSFGKGSLSRSRPSFGVPSARRTSTPQGMHTSSTPSSCSPYSSSFLLFMLFC